MLFASVHSVFCLISKHSHPFCPFLLTRLKMARGTTASRDLYEASSLHVLKTKGEPDKRELVTVSETSTKSLRHSSIRYEPPEWLIVKTYSWR